MILAPDTPPTQGRQPSITMQTKLTTMAVTGAVTIGAILPAGAETAQPSGEVERTEVAPMHDGPTDLQVLVRDFREQRADFLLARQQLRHQLAVAETPEQRRLILRQFFEQNRERIRGQTELRRELRRRQIEIRRQRRMGNPGN